MSGQEAGEERHQQRKRSGAGGERWGSDGVCQGEDRERGSENPALALATWRSSVTWIGACVGEDERDELEASVDNRLEMCCTGEPRNGAVGKVA